MFVFFQYKFYMSFESINSFIRRAHNGKLMSGCMQCDEERRRLRILRWRATTAGISFHLRKQMLQSRRTLKRRSFLFTGCILDLNWDTARNIPYIYIEREREEDGEVKKKWRACTAGKWVISSHLSCPEALKYVYFYFKHILLCQTRARAHSQTHCTLHSLCSVTDKTVDETVFWTKRALLHRGGVTGAIGTWVFTLNITGCRFSSVPLTAKMSEKLWCYWSALCFSVYGVHP